MKIKAHKHHSIVKKERLLTKEPFLYAINAMFLSIILVLSLDFQLFQLLDAPFPSKRANFLKFEMKNFYN